MSGNRTEEMSFWDHLTELLGRFRRIFYAFIISTLVVMVVPIRIDLANQNLFYQTIASTLISDLPGRFLADNVDLIPLSFFAPLEVYFFISVVLGATISLPIASYELYKFFSPALYEREKRFALEFTVPFIGLFTFGLIFGYLFILPVSFQTMLSFSNLMSLSPTYNFVEFFSMVGMMLLMSGLLFTFPIYIYVLVRAGILRTEQLTKNRKYLYGFILIAIAILDPEPSLITEGFTFIPIVLLMEISIFFSKRVERDREVEG